jgi:beta-glucosidase
VARPPRWLAGFGHAEAEPGTELTVRIQVPVRSLAHWDHAAGAWAVEPGRYELGVGRSSRDLRLTTHVTIGPVRSSGGG